MAADTEKDNPGQRNEDFGAIDVTTLKEQVRLEAPRGTVTVRGIVERLQPWPIDQPTAIYGDLRDIGQQSLMSFRCSLATAPRLLKEPVVLRGTLTAKRSNQHRGFDLELVGSRVGEWTPSESVTPQLVALERATPKLSLERFLSKDAAKRLVLIRTKRAIEDVETTLRRGSKQSLGTRVSTTGLENLQAVIAEVAQKYDGLCFVRGGGDPHSFTTWNDSRLIAALINCGKPFYTALGHSNDLTLADKYADESFGTPSDLGSACTEAWRARERYRCDRPLLARPVEAGGRSVESAH